MTKHLRNKVCHPKQKQKWQCLLCNKTFDCNRNLKTHLKNKICQKKFKCTQCSAEFKMQHELRNHNYNVHILMRYLCEFCGKGFQTMNGLETHSIKYHYHPVNANHIQVPAAFTRDSSSFKGYLNCFTHYPRDANNIPHFLDTIQPSVEELFSNVYRILGPFKFITCLHIDLEKTVTNDDDEIVDVMTSSAHFATHPITYTTPELADQSINKVNLALGSKLDTYNKGGSNWEIKSITQMDIHVGIFRPIRGGCTQTLDKYLTKKGGVLNIPSSDGKCFLYSVLAGLHPDVPNPTDCNSYTPYLDEIIWEDYPMPLNAIPMFERNNDIKVLVYGYENTIVSALHISEEKYEREVMVLLLENNHYCLIQDYNKLMSLRSRHNAFCRYCGQNLSLKTKLEEHESRCKHFKHQRIFMPKGEKAIMKFQNIRNQHPSPYTVYADFECILKPISGPQPNPSQSYTHPYQQHEPCGFGYIVVTPDGKVRDHKVYRGVDCVERFLVEMRDLHCEIMKQIDDALPKNLTPEELASYEANDTCHICRKDITEKSDKVQDHDHIFSADGRVKFGKYRGPAHKYCNFQYRVSRKLPIFFHNLKNYDLHLIVKALDKFPHDKISVIPQNSERYMALYIDKLTFLDSLNFLNSSLDTLVGLLDPSQFKVLGQIFDHDHSFLLKKGVYPYEYVQNWDVFEEKSLPDKAAFTSSLTQQEISDEDYERAKFMWEKFNSQNMGDYHDLYLLLDCVLLADCFQNFRETCKDSYDLDPTHYVSLPSFSWDAALKFTGVKLELLTDINMHEFIELGLRGGVAQISHRFERANHPQVPGYDPNQERVEIIYLDANNLYGWAMCESLPLGNFQWLSPDNTDFLTADAASPIGYIIECDLGYDRCLHDLHAGYPLAPEHIVVETSMRSNYVQASSVKTKKLIPNLYDKANYIVHYRNLQYYVNLGMKLKKVHKILSFDQRAWLKPYIEFNTQKRAEAKDSFTKNLMKLYNNSCFGKTMENLRNRTDVRLVTDPTTCKNLLAKPSVKFFRPISENLAIFQMHKTTITLNRPIYVGFTVLDLSKLCMYEFHYGFIKKQFSKSTLLMTDTDSLVYLIYGGNFYEVMAKNLDRFDTSDYPKTHSCYSDINKKKPGVFKDELNGVPFLEFCGLKAKMYSFEYLDEEGEIKDKKVGKGILKSELRKLKHKKYVETLQKKRSCKVKFNLIRSKLHTLQSVQVQKVGLSYDDDKRYVLSDGIHTLPYGHYSVL